MVLGASQRTYKGNLPQASPEVRISELPRETRENPQPNITEDSLLNTPIAPLANMESEISPQKLPRKVQANRSGQPLLPNLHPHSKIVQRIGGSNRILVDLQRPPCPQIPQLTFIH